MKHVDSLTVNYHGRKVGTLSFTPERQLCAFEYDAQWIADGFSISPLELPLRQGIFTAKPAPLGGNFGIFEDSLPDGYGRYLLHKALLKDGINDDDFTAIDRLSIVGDNGMGALTYAPATNIITGEDTTDFDLLQQKALEVLRERQSTDAGLLLFNSGNSGGARPKAVFSDDEGHWLIKFRHTYDSKDIGEIELHYNETARKCGIDVLALTGFLTQNPADVEEMFRRMVFNYLTDNKDDHCKNFSFLAVKNDSGKTVWRLAPAYDLTLCNEGYNGQHATSVNGTGTPALADFLEAGRKIRISEPRCRQLFEQVAENCRDITKYNPK